MLLLLNSLSRERVLLESVIWNYTQVNKTFISKVGYKLYQYRKIEIIIICNFIIFFYQCNEVVSCAV